MNSQYITPKISSHRLSNKHEQFNLNYSTKHIFSQKYFMNTIHMNSETLGLLFMANHPIIGSICEPKFHGHFQPHTNQHMIYSTNYTINNPNSLWTVTVCPHGFLKIPHLDSKIWNRSDDSLRPQTNRSITKHLNKV